MGIGFLETLESNEILDLKAKKCMKRIKMVTKQRID